MVATSNFNAWVSAECLPSAIRLAIAGWQHWLIESQHVGCVATVAGKMYVCADQPRLTDELLAEDTYLPNWETKSN